MSHEWTFGANDPDFPGWLTTIAYFAVAALCCASGRWAAAPRGDRTAGSPRAFWYTAAGLLLCLGVNKQLDLQTPFIDTARMVAASDGWYPHRRLVQWVFLGCLAAAGLGTMLWAVWRSRRNSRDYMPVCLGIALLLMYVIIRGSPVQHVSRIFGIDVSAIRGKRHIMELSGILCIGFGAAAALGHRQKSNKEE